MIDSMHDFNATVREVPAGSTVQALPYRPGVNDFEVGATLALQYPHNGGPAYRGPVYVARAEASNRDLGNIAASWRYIGDAPGATWSHSEPGTYVLRAPASETGDGVSHVMDKYVVTHAGGEGYGPPADSLNTDDPGPSPSDIATSTPGLVPADNDEGIALAPALRREGASLGPDGATVTLPDGDTVDVGAISESDEVARYLDGENAGEVVDADQPAINGGSSSGGSGGMIGGAVAVVLALVVGAAAFLGGGD